MGWLGFHALPHQILHFRPELRIALALHVAGCDDAIKPGKPFAPHRLFPVVEAVIAEYVGFGFVCGPNVLSAMDEPMRLIEIDGRGYIIGDYLVVLPELCDAIDLNGEHDGDVHAIQFPRQQYGGRRSPALPKEDDVGRSFLFAAEMSVMVGVEQVEDRAVGGLAMAIFENLNVRVFRSILLDAFGQQHGSMMWIGVTHKPADEADDNVGGAGLTDADDSAIGCAHKGGCHAQNEQRDKGTESGESKHARAPS